MDPSANVVEDCERVDSLAPNGPFCEGCMSHSSKHAPREEKRGSPTTACEVEDEIVQERYNGVSRPTAKSWNTTILRFGPIAGICALLLAVVSLLVALAILIGSRGDSKVSVSESSRGLD